MRKPSLEAFFKPEAVAVIGASEKSPRSGRPWCAISSGMASRAGFTRLTANTRKSRDCPPIPGLPKSRNPSIWPSSPFPSGMCPRLCGNAASRGIGAAIIISAGGKETGLRGQEIEAAIKEEAQKAGIRYLGPNCLGILYPSSKLHASFAPVAPAGQPGLHLPSGALSAFRSRVGHPQENRLQPLYQPGVHGRRGFRRSDRLPGLR